MNATELLAAREAALNKVRNDGLENLADMKDAAVARAIVTVAVEGAAFGFDEAVKFMEAQK